MMNESELELRLVRTEKEVDDLHDTIEALRESTTRLALTVALLEQTMRSVQAVENQRGAFNQRVTFFVIGGAVSAAMAFVVRGGLVL